jgi:DNA-binding transcriptional regulator YhcF (GntR family)
MSLPVPIYIQIVNAIKLKIAQKELSAEEKLPSVRELALLLKINPNTVQSAYRELVHENVAYKKKGIGLFINKDIKKIIGSERKKQMKEAIKKMILFGMKLGYSENEIVEIVKEITGGEVK